MISLVFIFLFYIIPLNRLVIDRLLVFPVLGREGSWLMTAGSVYVLLALVGLALIQFEEVVWPSLPQLRRKLTRRTGIYRLDGFGLRFSVLSSALFLATDVTLVPLGVAATLGFLSLSRSKVEVRTVAAARHPGAGEAGRADTAAGEPAGGGEHSETRLRPRRFEWNLKGALGAPISGVVEVAVDKDRYEAHRASNPYSGGEPARKEYQRLVLEGVTPEVETIAAELRSVAQEHELSSFQELNIVLAFVQSIPLMSDRQTKGRRYTRWPIETIYDRAGDSDCKSVLLAALYRALGHPAVIVEARGRTAVGVAGAQGVPGRFLNHRGRRFYYADPTSPGLKVGQLPPDLPSEQVLVYSLPS